MTYQELLQKALEMDKARTEKNVMLSNAWIAAFLMDNCQLRLRQPQRPGGGHPLHRYLFV